MDARTGRWVLAATILGSSMAFIDVTVVNVALPVLQEDLRADVSEVQWIVESYQLFLAALLLVGGALGDRFGRRRVFVLGVTLFAAASAACGLAQTPLQLIVARAVQGIGGALLVPGSLSIIRALFPEDQRGKAIGTWSAFSAVTTSMGPVLGGWLVETFSWRWVFLINIPIAVAVVAIAQLRVPESRRHGAEQGGLDVSGALLAVAGFGGLVYALVEASGRGRWLHADLLVAAGVGIAALAGFLLVEHRRKDPMLPLGLFRIRTFTGANVLTLLLYAALTANLFFLPFVLIQVHGYSATGAGAALLPFVAILSLFSRWAGGLVDRYGARGPLTIGPIVAAAGFASFALPGTGGSYWTTFFPAALVLGIGMALTVAPLTTAVMGSVEDEFSGVASGVNNAISRVGGLLAIAVMGIVLMAFFTRGLEARLVEASVPEPVRAEVMQRRTDLASAQPPAGLDEETRLAVERAIDGAFVEGFRAVAIGSGLLALAGGLAAWFLVERRAARPV